MRSTDLAEQPLTPLPMTVLGRVMGRVGALRRQRLFRDWASVAASPCWRC